MKTLLGSELSPDQQAAAKARFVHRYTGDHRPQWSYGIWKEKLPYPLQFVDDADWLVHTRFGVTASGRLSERATSCYSCPTWPNNPELRTGNQLPAHSLATSVIS
jgi:hypothetical protein